MSERHVSGPLLESQEHQGYWWLPEDGAENVPADASKRLAGQLTLIEGRAELAVLGNFGHRVLSESDSGAVYSPIPADVDRVLGLTSSGKPVTLERCVTSASQMNFPGITTTTYRASAALFGAWFEQDEEIAFDEIAIELSDFDTWVGTSGIRQSISTKKDDEGRSIPSAIDIHYEPPSPIEIPLNGGDSARIRFSFTTSGMDAVTTEARVSQAAALYYRFAKPQKLDDVPGVVGHLRNFLSLAVGRPVSLLSVTGYQDEFIREGHTFREPIRLFWDIRRNPKPSGRRRHPTEMLFRFTDAEPGTADALQAWFARKDVLEPVFDLYFAVTYNPDLFAEVRFLLLAQALETYDFRQRGPHELPPQEHKERLNAVLAASPDEWHNWLRTRLSSNYRVLDQRIRDVLDECPPVAARIVGAERSDVTRFVRDIKSTRNYYTHYTPKLERRAVTDATERHLLTTQLKAIIEMALLKELGFSCDTIDAALDRVQRYAEIQHFRAAVRERTDAHEADLD